MELKKLLQTAQQWWKQASQPLMKSVDKDIIGCIELALYFLKQQMEDTYCHPAFKGISAQHIRRLKIWYDTLPQIQAILKTETPCAFLEFASPDEIRLLLKAIQYGIQSHTITGLSLEKTIDVMRFIKPHVKQAGDVTRYKTLKLKPDDLFDCNFQYFIFAYTEMAKSKEILILKSQALLGKSSN